MNNFSLITGASSGIGRDLARVAAKDCRNLVLTARSKAKLLELKSELTKKYGVKIEIIDIDLSLAESPQKVFDFCKSKNIVVSELINNAGFGDYGDFADSDPSKQLNMIDLNVRSLTAMTHLFIQPMIAAKRGKIMNVASVAAFIPGPSMSVYFATKHYVLAFSEALAQELAGSGVSVTTLCPGATKTNFANQAHVSKNNAISTTKVTAADVAEFGRRAMQKSHRVAVHGVSNRLMIGLVRFLPRNLLASLVQKVQK